jgi:flagella synthesis protein FlgN
LSQTSPQHRFHHLIQNEKEQVSRLLALLKQEEAALVKRDVDGMEKAVAEKQLVIAELEKLAVERSNVLVVNGFSDDKQGFEGYLSSLDEASSSTVQQQWEELQELLRTCQHQNQANGQILESSRRNTEKALSLLIGRAGESDTRLYNEKGTTNRSIGSKSHVKV